MRIVALGFSVIFGLFHIVNVQQDAFAHKTDVHGYCMEKHDTEHPNLTQHAAEIADIDFLSSDIIRMKEGAVDEDKSIEYILFVIPWPVLRYRHHHYNPHTGSGGPWGGSPAIDAATGLWGAMGDLFDDPENRWKGDTEGSLHTLGRVLHLLQDMAAPPHVHADKGHGWLNKKGPFGSSGGFYSDFEETWSPSSGAHQNWSFPPSAEDDPLTPMDVANWSSASSIPSSKLDPTSFSEMMGKIDGLDNTIAGYMNAQAWVSYFHSSFYGKIQKCEETPMPAYTGQGENNRESVLAIMFDEERLEFHNGENDAFWEIVGVGHYEKDNTHFPDDWWPCPGSYPEGNKEVNGGSAKMGRFYIYLHYYQEDEEGNIDGMDFSVADPPGKWPNGDDNDGTSLAKYYGDVLLPLSARFGAGLLEEVFPAPESLEYPFQPDEIDEHYIVAWEMPGTPSVGSLTGAKVERSTDEGASWEEGNGEVEVLNDMLSYKEVWPTDTTGLEAGESYRYRVRAEWFEDVPTVGTYGFPPIVGPKKTGDLDYEVSAPPRITKLKVRQDSTDDSVFERLIYEFAHDPEGEYEVGEEFLTDYQKGVVGSGEGGRTLQLKVVFSETIDTEWDPIGVGGFVLMDHKNDPDRYSIVFEDIAWSETSSPNDTATGTLVISPRSSTILDSCGALDAEYPIHDCDGYIWVYGRHTDYKGIIRFLDTDGDGTANAYLDTNHGLKIDTKHDQSPEIRIESIHD